MKDHDLALQPNFSELPPNSPCRTCSFFEGLKKIWDQEHIHYMLVLCGSEFIKLQTTIALYREKEVGMVTSGQCFNTRQEQYKPNGIPVTKEVYDIAIKPHLHQIAADNTLYPEDTVIFEDSSI